MSRKALRNSRRILALSAAVLLGPSLAHSDPAPAGTTANPLPETGRALVGAIVGGREVGTLEIFRDAAGSWIPLEPLSGLLAIDLRWEDGAAVLTTPLGETTLPAATIELLGERHYVPGRTLAEALAAEIVFDPARYALRFDLPWRRGAGVFGKRAERTTPEPDVAAPQSTISNLHASLNHTRVAQASDFNGALRMDGRWMNGVWRARAENSSGSGFEMREYQWYARHDRTRYLLGRQRLQLHPALGGFDLAGLQVAWTRGEREAGGTSYGTGVLLPRRMRPVDTIEGPAVPGSFARLRVDGRAVDSQQVGFDGRYRFHDVVLPSRQIARIEVQLYAPGDLQIPIETHRHRIVASDLLLPAGEAIHAAGAGVVGRFTRGFVDNETGRPRPLGGFYQWRQGLSRHVTGEAAIQFADRETQSFAGIVARPADSWIVGLGLAHTPGAVGYNLDLEGHLPRWRFAARSSSVPAEFGLFGTGLDRHDHSAELTHDPNSTLRVGLLARRRDDGFESAEYVLPTLTWRPSPELFADARPDLDGDYMLDALWQIDRDTHVRLFAAETSNVELSREMSANLRFHLGTDFGGGLAPRHTIFASRTPGRPRGWYLKAGCVYTEDRLGLLFGGDATVYPGVFVRAEYQTLPYRSLAGGPDPDRFVLSIVTDLSPTAGRFVPAPPLAGRRDRGAIAGRVKIDPSETVAPGGRPPSYPLDEIGVLVDGRVRTRTDRGGWFYVPDLEEGAHLVELDPEHMPIELNPLRTRLTAAVAAGAVTRTDFPVRPEFGLAGRVTGPAGEPRAGLRIELADSQGRIVARGRTDRFGLYRLDGVPSGSYTLRVCAEAPGRDPEPLAELAVRVRGEFLFDQDLTVPDAEEQRPADSQVAASIRIQSWAMLLYSVSM